MKRSLISLMLVICLICSFVPVTASAAKIEYSGQFREVDLSWTLDENGLLTISGSGRRYECMGENTAWLKYKGMIKSVVVEDGITAIGEKYFYKCTSLESVTIADSVQSIHKEAFSGCSWLKELTLPDSVTYIGRNAFYNCRYLESVDFGSALTEIDYGAFDCCRSLKDITFPASLTKLGSYSFRACDDLRSATFLGDAPVFGGSPFSASGGFSDLNLYYPANNPTWTADVLSVSLGGRTVWVPYGESAAVPGDLDGDGQVNDADVAYLLWHTLFPDSFPIDNNADFDGDGQVNDADVAYLLWHTLFPDAYPL